jgi:hypothetical protein
VVVATVDLKTRRKIIIKTLKTSSAPTCIYEVDKDQVLVGTENGNIEQIYLQEENINKIEAHSGTVTSISELKSLSDLMWPEQISLDKREYN